jgi:hypothetical protein
LIDALGPDVAQREVDPDIGDVTLRCERFNERNFYDRQTPGDQDYLRQLARDTQPEELEQWYNEHVAVLYQDLAAYDSEGLFIDDGTYLFVPDHENYEDSQRLSARAMAKIRPLRHEMPAANPSAAAAAVTPVPAPATVTGSSPTPGRPETASPCV